MLKLVVVSFLLCCTSGSAAYPWLPVDVGAVVCFNADMAKHKNYSATVQFAIPKKPTVPELSKMSQDEISTTKDNRFKPHIITFFRTTSKAVTIKYRVKDAIGTTLIDGTAEVKDYLCERTAPTVYKWCPLEYKIPKLMENTLADLTLPDTSGGIGGRRLEDRLRDPHWHPPQVKVEDLLEAEDEDEEEELDDEDSSSRKLLSGRSGQSDRSLSGRSLKSKGGKVSSSKSKSPPPSPSKKAPTPTVPRRRATAPSGARRRAGAPAETGDRRRISSPVDGSSHKNPNPKSKAGSYGYASKSSTSKGGMDKNFKGGSQKTKYGYSGKKSYSTGAVMLAVGGGVILGAGAMYMYSHNSDRYSQWGRSGWGWRNVECHYDSKTMGCWKDTDMIDVLTMPGECGSSFSKVWPEPPLIGSLSAYDRSCYKCNQQKFWTKCQRKTMSYALNRDDIMATGFIPADVKSPVTITVYSVTGADFTMPGVTRTPLPDVCPPQNWNATSNTPTWTQPTKDIYITLTAMAPLSDAVSVSAAPVHGLSIILGLCIFVLSRLR